MPAKDSFDRCQTVLLTGAHGFVGARLSRRLKVAFPDWSILTPEGPGSSAESLDVTNPKSVAGWIRKSKPNVVVHLAAIAAVTEAIRNPRQAWDVNLYGTLNLVHAVQELVPGAAVVYISSAEVYGQSLHSAGPVDETALLQPTNPYAASKAAADLLMRQAAFDGTKTIVMRPFNHTGAGQAEAFVAPNFAAQIARIEAGLLPPILQVGCLEDERDFLDVEDVVSAYVGVLQNLHQMAPGEVFNVASGRSWAISQILEMLLSYSTVRIEVREDASRLRNGPVTKVVGDATRLADRIDWRPHIPFPATLREILDEKRAAVANS